MEINIFQNISAALKADANSLKKSVVYTGAPDRRRLCCACALASRDYSHPTKANRARFPARSPPDFARGNRAGRCRWSAGFLGDLPFPPPFHPGAAAYSLRFTLIGSQDLYVQSHPNLFTPCQSIALTQTTARQSRARTFLFRDPCKAFLFRDPCKAFLFRDPCKAFLFRDPCKAFLFRDPCKAFLFRDPCKAFLFRDPCKAFLFRDPCKAFLFRDPCKAFLFRDPCKAFLFRDPCKAFLFRDPCKAFLFRDPCKAFLFRDPCKAFLFRDPCKAFLLKLVGRPYVCGEYGVAPELEGGGNGRSRENPPTRGIVRHDGNTCENPGVARPGIEPGLTFGGRRSVRACKAALHRCLPERLRESPAYSRANFNSPARQSHSSLYLCSHTSHPLVTVATTRRSASSSLRCLRTPSSKRRTILQTVGSEARRGLNSLAGPIQEDPSTPTHAERAALLCKSPHTPWVTTLPLETLICSHGQDRDKGSDAQQQDQSPGLHVPLTLILWRRLKTIVYVTPITDIAMLRQRHSEAKSSIIVAVTSNSDDRKKKNLCTASNVSGVLNSLRTCGSTQLMHQVVALRQPRMLCTGRSRLTECGRVGACSGGLAAGRREAAPVAACAAETSGVSPDRFTARLCAWAERTFTQLGAASGGGGDAIVPARGAANAAAAATLPSAGFRTHTFGRVQSRDHQPIAGNFFDMNTYFKFATIVGSNTENPMITKSGDTVWHCSRESIVYIQNSITPLDCQRIKEYVTLSKDCDASGGCILNGNRSSFCGWSARWLRLVSDEFGNLRLDSRGARKPSTRVCRTYPKVFGSYSRVNMLRGCCRYAQLAALSGEWINVVMDSAPAYRDKGSWFTPTHQQVSSISVLRFRVPTAQQSTSHSLVADMIRKYITSKAGAVVAPSMPSHTWSSRGAILAYPKQYRSSITAHCAEPSTDWEPSRSSPRCEVSTTVITSLTSMDQSPERTSGGAMLLLIIFYDTVLKAGTSFSSSEDPKWYELASGVALICLRQRMAYAEVCIESLQAVLYGFLELVFQDITCPCGKPGFYRNIVGAIMASCSGSPSSSYVVLHPRYRHSLHQLTPLSGKQASDKDYTRTRIKKAPSPLRARLRTEVQTFHRTEFVSQSCVCVFVRHLKTIHNKSSSVNPSVQQNFGLTSPTSEIWQIHSSPYQKHSRMPSIDKSATWATDDLLYSGINTSTPSTSFAVVSADSKLECDGLDKYCIQRRMTLLLGNKWQMCQCLEDRHILFGVMVWRTIVPYDQCCSGLPGSVFVAFQQFRAQFSHPIRHPSNTYGIRRDDGFLHAEVFVILSINFPKPHDKSSLDNTQLLSLALALIVESSTGNPAAGSSRQLPEPTRPAAPPSGLESTTPYFLPPVWVRFPTKDEVDRSRWLRTTNLRVPTPNCFYANTFSEIGMLLEFRLARGSFATQQSYTRPDPRASRSQSEKGYAHIHVTSSLVYLLTLRQNKLEVVVSAINTATGDRVYLAASALNRKRLERASQKQSSDTHKTPYDQVKRCRERKINIKASGRINVDVFTQNKRLYPQHSETQYFGLKSTYNGAKVSGRLARSPPTKANRAQFPVGSLPDFRMWESCRTMPLVGGFSRRSPVSSSISFRRCSIRTSITSSTLKSSLLRAAQISSLTNSRRDILEVELQHGFTKASRCVLYGLYNKVGKASHKKVYKTQSKQRAASAISKLTKKCARLNRKCRASKLMKFLLNSNKLLANSSIGAQREPIERHFENEHAWWGEMCEESHGTSQGWVTGAASWGSNQKVWAASPGRGNVLCDEAGDGTGKATQHGRWAPATRKRERRMQVKVGGRVTSRPTAGYTRSRGAASTIKVPRRRRGERAGGRRRPRPRTPAAVGTTTGPHSYLGRRESGSGIPGFHSAEAAAPARLR
ncbi:hypothetical protein PR048_003172 [Dryococelus australis]|uniref:Uncharacterized protein n=1 Tax=Dryococelus australis TaxID=614101 RepID=A0ABQ9INN4_9NEOP|nr:hypothetical protein PR048_003172 [Dryococelus australis]